MNQENILFPSTIEIKTELSKLPAIGSDLIKNGLIYRHTILLFGLLNRTFELTESAIWAIDNNRPHTAANMLRALIETLGFIFHVKKQIDLSSNLNQFEEKIKFLLEGSQKGKGNFKLVNILTCIDKATKKYSKLRKNYDELSEVVHPNPSSHFYASKMTGQTEKGIEVEFRVPSYEFKGEDKKNITNQVGECCCHIRSLCEEIINNLERYSQ